MGPPAACRRRGRSLPFSDLSRSFQTWGIGPMAFREVHVIEVREGLRGWLAGAGLRTLAAPAGVDRTDAARDGPAAPPAPPCDARPARGRGAPRAGGPGQVTDEVRAAVVSAVRPVRPARAR